MSRRRRRAPIVLSALISAMVLVYLVLAFDWERMLESLAGVRWGWLALGLSIFLLNYVLRTLRFQGLVYSQKLRLYPLMGVISLYGMFNYLLPARTGELSYLMLVKHRHGVSLGESAATLMAARFCDFMAVALLLPVVVAAFWDSLADWMLYAAAAFCVVAYGMGICAVLVLRGSEAIRPRKKAPENAVYARIVTTLHEIMEGFRIIHRRGRYGRLWLLTFGIWLCVYVYLYAIVRSLGVGATLLEVVVVSIMLIPLSLLPVQGVANLGSHEVAWVAAFALFGYSFETSLYVAVTTHAIVLTFVMLMGAGGALLLLFERAKGTPATRLREHV